MANLIICQKLKEARKSAGLSQKDVYEWLGISQSTFSSWETGKSSPPIKAFLQLCVKYEIDNITDYFLSDGIYNRREAFDLTILNKLAELPKRGRDAVLNCLEFEHDYMISNQHKTSRTIRVYLQSAAAGLGNPLSDTSYENVKMDAPPEAVAGIRISGDSMEPEIQNGQIVFIDSSQDIEDGQIGIFVLNGEAFCKVPDRSKGGLLLRSFNPKYSPINVSPSDNIRVIGRVLR